MRKRLTLATSTVPKGTCAFDNTSKTRDPIQNSLGFRLIWVGKRLLEGFLRKRCAVVLVDVESTVTPRLLPHQSVQRDESEAVMFGESAILPLHGMLDVILVRDLALSGFNKIRDPSRKQGRASQ